MFPRILVSGCSPSDLGLEREYICLPNPLNYCLKTIKSQDVAQYSPNTVAIPKLYRKVKRLKPQLFAKYLNRFFSGTFYCLFIICPNGREIFTAFPSSEEKINFHDLPPNTSFQTAYLIMPLSVPIFLHVFTMPTPPTK